MDIAVRSESMMAKRIRTTLTGVVWLLVFTLSLSTGALAQKSIWDKTKEGAQKGAEGVKKGAETVGEKTKEGAEEVGHGVKKVFTDDDKDSENREKGNMSQEKSTVTREGGTSSRSTVTREGASSAGRTATSSTTTSRRSRELPSTAGEIPLLALGSVLAFACAGATQLMYRKRK
jgi:hypothetical protein